MPRSAPSVTMSDPKTGGRAGLVAARVLGSNGLMSMSDEELARLRKAFALVDQDGDGRLTYDELGDLTRAMGVERTPDDLWATIEAADMNHDGGIDFVELQRLLGERAMTTDQARAMFRSLDLDGDGYVSREELRACLDKLGGGLTAEAIDELIREADGDADGRIGFAEFARSHRLSARG